MVATEHLPLRPTLFPQNIGIFPKQPPRINNKGILKILHKSTSKKKEPPIALKLTGAECPPASSSYPPSLESMILWVVLDSKGIASTVSANGIPGGVTPFEDPSSRLTTLRVSSVQEDTTPWCVQRSVTPSPLPSNHFPPLLSSSSAPHDGSSSRPRQQNTASCPRAPRGLRARSSTQEQRPPRSAFHAKNECGGEMSLFCGQHGGRLRLLINHDVKVHRD